MAEFSDVVIVGIDPERTVNPNPNLPYYNVHIRLSETPPKEWIESFEQHWFPSLGAVSMWKAAEVVDSFIVVKQVELEDIGGYRDHLSQTVGAANRDYREALDRAEREDARRKAEEDEERRRVREFANKIKF